MKHTTLKKTEAEEHHHSQDLNNSSENKAVASTALICLLGKKSSLINFYFVLLFIENVWFLGLSIMATKLIGKKSGPLAGNSDSGFRDIVILFMMNFLLPFAIVVKNKDIQNHGKERMRELILFIQETF